MSETMTRNSFNDWLDRMADELGLDAPLSIHRSAELLGISYRMAAYYAEGKYAPREDTRKLMAAIAEGFKPKAWPA